MSGSANRPGWRWLRVALILSLGLNLAVAGLVAGFLLRGPSGGLSGWNGPGGVAQLLHALPAREHDALRDDLRRGGHAAFRAARAEIRASRSELAATLRAEPYSEAALRAALEKQDAVWREIGGRTREALLARIAAMTPEARRALAEALESRQGERHVHGGGVRGGE